MKQRLSLLFKYYLLWYLYFVFVKFLFLIFNYPLLQKISFSDFWGVFIHGFKLDISASTYLLALPFLLLIPSIFVSAKYFKPFLKYYTSIFLIVISLLVVIDIELYKYWGFRLDRTPLMYIKTPGDMLASVKWYVIVKQILVWILLSILSIWLFLKYLLPLCDKIKKGKIWELPVWLVLFASLILPIRGGTDVAPLNTGTAYFSKNEFANHSAINVFWNFSYSLSQSQITKNPYIFMDKDEAQQTIKNLYNTEKSEIKLLKTDRPNLVIIVLESFTCKVIEPLGGFKGITPRFNKLVHEGIFFKNLYASGFRSEKGLTSIFSGHPATPVFSIMKYPEKTAKIPFLSKDLEKYGYQSAFYYGGDINFISMKSYFNNGHFRITAKTEFPSSTYNSKWGVHDNIIFNRFINDLDTASQPFLYGLFTLSSHEPFEVPMKTIIPGNDEESQFMNSVYFTDSVLGDFIQKAKAKKWWDNTLIVLVADHGTRIINNSPNNDPIRYHIPMLWLGGALNVKDTVIQDICSQTDIPLTILNQMNITPEKPYAFSNDIFNTKREKFAFFAFNNGWGMVSESSKVSYDNDLKRIVYEEGKKDSSLFILGKTYLQVVYDDFIHK